MIVSDHISKSLETIFWVKKPGSGIFFTLDPGFGMEKIRIWDVYPAFLATKILNLDIVSLNMDRKQWFGGK
jgi:hypothetical protein